MPAIFNGGHGVLLSGRPPVDVSSLLLPVTKAVLFIKVFMKELLPGMFEADAL